MKKLFIATALTLSFMLGGCEMKGTAEETDMVLNNAYDCGMKVRYNDTEYEGTISRIGKGVWDAEFSAPETLAGVKLSFMDDNVTASYKGLSFTVPESAYPLKSVILCFITAVDEFAETENPQYKTDDKYSIAEGSIEAGNYKLTLDKTSGCLVAFEMDNVNSKIEFYDMNIHAAAESETVLSETDSNP